MNVSLNEPNNETDPAQQFTKSSYPLHDASMMGLMFDSDSGYLRVPGGDTINFGLSNEPNLKICTFVEGTVTEIKCNTIAAFKAQLEQQKDFYESEF